MVVKSASRRWQLFTKQNVWEFCVFFYPKSSSKTAVVDFAQILRACSSRNGNKDGGFIIQCSSVHQNRRLKPFIAYYYEYMALQVVQRKRNAQLNFSNDGSGILTCDSLHTRGNVCGRSFLIFYFFCKATDDMNVSVRAKLARTRRKNIETQVTSSIEVYASVLRSTCPYFRQKL